MQSKRDRQSITTLLPFVDLLTYCIHVMDELEIVLSTKKSNLTTHGAYDSGHIPNKIEFHIIVHDAYC